MKGEVSISLELGEAIEVLQFIEERRKGTDKKEETVQPIATEELENSDDEVMDGQIALNFTSSLTEEEQIDNVLSINNLSLSKSDSGGSPSLNVIGCTNRFYKWFRIMGFDEMNFVLSILHQSWSEFGGQHFNCLIFDDVCAFVHAYYSDYVLSADRLMKQLCTAGRGSKTTEPITPSDFRKMIKQAKVQGKATLDRYNYGYTDGQRLPDILDQFASERRR